jgi:hypothetical protein
LKSSTYASRSAQFLFAASALAFAASTYVFAGWNDVPWVLPVPGDGSIVKTPFFISTPGNFRVRISVPTRSETVESPVPPGFRPPCLMLSLDSKTDTELNAFRSAGLFVYGGLAYYESEKELHVGFGKHTVALKACAPAPRGQSFVEFQRAGEPAAMAVGGWLVRGAGWVLLALGGLATLAEVVSSHRARRGPEKPIIA